MTQVSRSPSDDLPILKGLLQYGMAPDYMSVRFGRVPKREKARIIAAMQSVQSRSMERSLLSELDNESSSVNTIIDAYLNTTEYTVSGIRQLRGDASSQPMYNYDPQSTSCPLFPASECGSNQSSFSVRFSKAIRGVINFALRLPGFSQIPTEDRFLLLKSGAFEALLVSLAGLYDSESNTFLCMNGRLMRRESVYGPSNSRFLMDSVCDYAERMNRLGLSDAELALFTAVIIVTPNRHGIRNKDLIERLHERLSTFLQNVLMRNRPDSPHIYRELMSFIPDLRTLNALHSDKSFCQRKMEQGSNLQVWNESRYPCDEETNMNSPSSYSPDEGIRSPTSYTDSLTGDSGSPDGSVCNSDISTYTVLQNSYSHNRRHREPSEGGSSGDETLEMGSTKCPFFKRKVENPDDSGIESDKVSLPSICSSPRSSIDEKVEEEREDDMPVLRRALQAPPIINTDLIMEEAYKPHKKFRAFRREEEQPHSSLSACPTSSSILAQTLSQPLPSESGSSLLASALSSPSLAKTLSEHPKMSEDSLKRADALHSLIIKKERGRRSPSYNRSSPAPYYTPHSLVERLQPSYPSDSFESQISSPVRETLNSHPRLHLLASPTPSRYHDPRSSPSLSARLNESPRPRTHSPTRSDNSLVELQVDISDSQPLNLSKKSPPTTPVLRIEV